MAPLLRANTRMPLTELWLSTVSSSRPPGWNGYDSPISFRAPDAFDVKTAVKETKAGKVEYRVDKTGVIHTAVGKVSFEENKIAENARALIEAVVKAKPSTAKGKYMKKVNLAATMSPGVLLDELAYV